MKGGVAQYLGEISFGELELDIVALVEDACAGIEFERGLTEAEFEVGFKIGKGTAGGKEIGLDIGFDGIDGDDALDIVGRYEESAGFDLQIEGREVFDGGVEMEGRTLTKVEIELFGVELCDLSLGAGIAEGFHLEAEADLADFDVGVEQVEMEVAEMGHQGGSDHFEVSGKVQSFDTKGIFAFSP